jgi:hypothetical protein
LVYVCFISDIEKALLKFDSCITLVLWTISHAAILLEASFELYSEEVSSVEVKLDHLD